MCFEARELLFADRRDRIRGLKQQGKHQNVVERQEARIRQENVQCAGTGPKSYAQPAMKS
jgi:hypothetical protein